MYLYRVDPLGALLSSYVCSQYRGRFPYSSQEVLWVCSVRLVKVGRLGQRLNIPTQGRRVAQTGDERPFSLTAPGSDRQPGIEPGPHW